MRADCTFANLGGDSQNVSAITCADCSGAVNAVNASVTLANSTFFDPIALPGASYVRAWQFALVLLTGCSFAPTPRLELTPFQAVSSGKIFGEGFLIRNQPGSLSVGPLPPNTADAAPNASFLDRSDPWFEQVQSVRPHASCITTPVPPRLRPRSCQYGIIHSRPLLLSTAPQVSAMLWRFTVNCTAKAAVILPTRHHPGHHPGLSLSSA